VDVQRLGHRLHLYPASRLSLTAVSLNSRL
jgi:hypothetical protein